MIIPIRKGKERAEIKDLPNPGQFSHGQPCSRRPHPAPPQRLKSLRPTRKKISRSTSPWSTARRQISLELIDPQGKPLTGVTAAGVWPVGQNHEENDAGPTVDVQALWPDEKRLVFLHHDGRWLGKASSCDSGGKRARADEGKADHAPPVTAQLVDRQKERALAGAVIRFEVEDPRPRPVLWETTDADGRFTNAMVPTGCEYVIYCQSPEAQLVTLAKGLSVIPGETVDLGKIDITLEERPRDQTHADGEKNPLPRRMNPKPR